MVRLRTSAPSWGGAGATIAKHMNRAALFSRIQLELEARLEENQCPRNCGEGPLPGQPGPCRAHEGGYPAPPCLVSSLPRLRAGLVQPPLPNPAQPSSSLEPAAEGAGQFRGGGCWGLASGCLRHWTRRGRDAGWAGGPGPPCPWVSVRHPVRHPCLRAPAQACVPDPSWAPGVEPVLASLSAPSSEG